MSGAIIISAQVVYLSDSDSRAKQQSVSSVQMGHVPVGTVTTNL